MTSLDVTHANRLRLTFVKHCVHAVDMLKDNAMNFDRRLVAGLTVLLMIFSSCSNDDDTDPVVVNPPMVTVTNPARNAVDVSRNKTISIIFSEAMDPQSINSNTFTLHQGNNRIAGEVAYANSVAILTPSSSLNANQAYTAEVTEGVKNLAGTALTEETIWTFTTGGTTANLAVVDLGTAGDYVILAKTAINNSSTSTITGDLGLSPAATSYITRWAFHSRQME